LEIARRRRNCPRRVVKRYLGGLPAQRFHHPDAVLRMAHLHTDIERFDVHVALEVCEIVIETQHRRFAAVTRPDLQNVAQRRGYSDQSKRERVSGF
jgi:hypothetical protein